MSDSSKPARIEATPAGHPATTLGTAKPDGYQDQTEPELVLGAARGKPVRRTLSKPASGDIHVLETSDHPWYLKLPSWSAQPLLAAAERGLR